MSDCKHTITLLKAAGANFYAVTHEAVKSGGFDPGGGGGVSLHDAEGHWLFTAASDGQHEATDRQAVRRVAPPDPFFGDPGMIHAARAVAGCEGLHGLQVEVPGVPDLKGEL